MNSKLKTQNSKLPFVFVNMAMTADGKIATANRALATFGSKRDHEHLLELRATADAVMAGANTVNAASINLGPGGAKFQRRRLKNGLAEHNLRVIVSGSGSINPDAEIFKQKFSPVIVLTTARIPKATLKRLREVAQVKICGQTKINFPNAFRWLREKWKVNRLLCEGGGELNDALFRAGLIDEIHLTICPKIFGGQVAPTIADGTGMGGLKNAVEFQPGPVRRNRNELFTLWTRIIPKR